MMLNSRSAIPRSFLKGAERRGPSATWSVLYLLRIYWLKDRPGTLFMLFHAVLLPMLIFYFAFRISQGQSQVLMRYLAGGISTGAGIGAITVVGFTMLADVQLGHIALIRTVGVAKWTYFLAHIITALVFGTFSVGFGLLLLNQIGVTHIEASQFGAALTVSFATGAATGSLGALVAATATDFATGRDRLSLASAGLAFLSPVFYDSGTLPFPLQIMTWASPFTHAAELNHSIVAGTALPLAHLAGAFLLSTALNIVAYRCLRWC